MRPAVAGCVLAAITGNVGIPGGWAGGIALQAPDGGVGWAILPEATRWACRAARSVVPEGDPMAASWSRVTLVDCRSSHLRSGVMGQGAGGRGR